MGKIKSDKHGLYIRTGGYVFRPVETDYNYHFKDTVNDSKSKFAAGEAASYRHISQTPHAKVTVNGVTEIWHSHGCYFDSAGKTVPSEQVWRPK